MTKTRATITDAFEAAAFMRVGGILMQMHTRTGMRWFIVPGGEVSASVAAKLLERRDVQPSGDGLFPGISQTFKLRSALRRLRDRAAS